MAFKFNPFTGNLDIEGPIITGTGTVSAAADGTAQVPGINFANDLNTGIYRPGADQVAISTNGTGRLFVTSDGKVGVGTTPGRILHVDSGAVNNSYARFTNANSTNSGVEIGLFDNGSSAGQLILNNSMSDGVILLFTNSTERARIDSSGRLLVGTSSSSQVGSTNSAIQIKGSGPDNGGASIARFSDNTASGYLSFGKARGSIGTPVIVDENDKLGEIQFAAYDGTDLASSAAAISAEVDGTPGANDMPGRLVFSTTADGASSPTERLRIDSSGNVGIGTSTTGTARLRFDNSVDTTPSNVNKIHLFNNGATVFGFGVSAGQLNYRAPAHSFYTDSSQALVIDSSGRLLVGTSSARSNFFNSTISAQVQIEGTTSTSRGVAHIVNSADNNSAYHIFAKSRGTAVGSNTIVNNNDRLAELIFAGNDGSEFVNAASIVAAVDGTPGANDMPGRLEFSTTADGSSTPTERVRITSEGYVFTDSTSSGLQASINTTSTGLKVASLANTSDAKIECFATSIATRYGIVFSNPNGVVGSISTNGSATAYNTSSDHRLKENVVDIADGITRVKQLQPRRFNFIADADTTVDGFLAHEAQTVVPEAVTGTHNEVDDDGNAVMQGIDQSKLVPLLTAALQEAIAKIETLETKVAALEAN